MGVKGLKVSVFLRSRGGINRLNTVLTRFSILLESSAKARKKNILVTKAYFDQTYLTIVLCNWALVIYVCVRCTPNMTIQNDPLGKYDAPHKSSAITRSGSGITSALLTFPDPKPGRVAEIRLHADQITSKIREGKQMQHVNVDTKMKRITQIYPRWVVRLYNFFADILCKYPFQLKLIIE